MLKNATRLFFLAPALTFGLGAAFVMSSFALGMSPGNPAVWHAFLTLAPLTRDPVNLVDSIPGVGYGITFLFFFAIAAASAAMAFTSWGSERMRYVSAHLALIAIVYSMGHVSMAYTSIGQTGPLTLMERFSRVMNFSTVSYELFALLIGVAGACLVTHASFIARIVEQTKARNGLDRQVAELSKSFSG